MQGCQKLPATGDIAGYFEVFAGQKCPLTITIREKSERNGPGPATFHHSPATSNLFDKPAVLAMNLIIVPLFSTH